MKQHWRIILKLREKRGATAVIVAIAITSLLGFAALSVDLGYLMITKNELQNAADAAALAGARKLGDYYKTNTTPVITDVLSVAQTTAVQNSAAGLKLDPANLTTAVITWSSSPALNAVEVKTNTAFNTFFAPILGVNKLNSAATATASLSGMCTGKPGLPLGMGMSWFTNVGANNGCTTISLNKTNESCAGWTNFENKYKKSDVEKLLKETQIMPTITAGAVADFGGGVSDLIVDLIDLFDRKKSGSPPQWTTNVVVYDDSSNSTIDACKNPNKIYSIIGFATITITGVTTVGSEKGLVGFVNCSVAQEGRGGCFYAGTFGTIPGLVK